MNEKTNNPFKLKWSYIGGTIASTILCIVLFIMILSCKSTDSVCTDKIIENFRLLVPSTYVIENLPLFHSNTLNLLVQLGLLFFLQFVYGFIIGSGIHLGIRIVHSDFSPSGHA